MSKTEKLQQKLENGTIDGNELATLLGRIGWRLVRQKGSHQAWTDGSRIMIVIAGRIQLKPYQIKDAQLILLPKKGDL